MNFKNLTILGMLTLFMLTACQKSNSNLELSQLSEINGGIAIKNGVVSFSTIANYLTVTENKNDNQKRAHFQFLGSSCNIAQWKYLFYHIFCHKVY
jgi:hypothetical protein